jgi:hypothetical protein
LTAVAASAQGIVPANVGPDHVTFYTEPNFRGESLTVEAGAAVESLDRLLRPSRRPWMYAISSIRVQGAARAVIYDAAGFAGQSLEITSSVPDLYAHRRGSAPGATWDRAVVSVRVLPIRAIAPGSVMPPVRYDNAPPSVVYVVPAPTRPIAAAPPPPRMDQRTADMIIHRAFRDVLDRSADPEGLRHYRQKLMREGWTERQIIQDLQRSREARTINADDAIIRAYREVLGRDPDAKGLAHYRGKWREGWTQGQIREDIRRSGEGRNTAIHQAIVRAYRELLGRDPDPAGYANYERLMRERGHTEADIRRAIRSGEEYRQRQAQ